MKKLTFPHLGNACIPTGLLLKELKIPYVIPAPNVNRTFEAGKAVSPEEICLPFKLMMGNILDGRQKGADAVIMPATEGPCRLGMYADFMNLTLKEMGQEMEFIIIDSPESAGLKPLKDKLGEIIPCKTCGRLKLIKSCRRGLELMRFIDTWEQQCFVTAGYAEEPSDCFYLRRDFICALSSAADFREAGHICDNYKLLLDKVKLDKKKKPVRLLVTGEIYTVIDSYSNHNIEDMLMKAGVSFQKGITISWWLRNSLLPEWIRRLSASSLLRKNIGGYARETVRDFCNFRELGFDGVIHIMPAGCMPEIVAETVAENLPQKNRSEILHLVYDEMTGSEGYITRVEAFIDMLERKRSKEKR